MSNEIYIFDLRPLARLGDFAVIVLSLIASGFTLVYEIGFPLLIWNRRLRPAFLVAAALLHGGITSMMGLWSFGFTMLIACCAFIPPEWLNGLGRKNRENRTARHATDDSPAGTHEPNGHHNHHDRLTGLTGKSHSETGIVTESPD